MDGIRTAHARCVLAACALAAALLAAAPAGAAPRTYGGLLGQLASRPFVAHGFQSREDPPAAATAQGAGQLTYHGGPVMRTNRVYAIYWVPQGYTVSAGYRTLIDGYFANVAADSGKRTNLYALNSEYGDATGQISYATTFAGSTLDTQPFPANGCTSVLPTCLTNAQLVAEIARVATQNGWTRGINSLFFVFTPRNVSTCWTSAGTFCFLRQFCAYHSWYQDSGGLIVFANMPYAATASACGAGWLSSPNQDDADLTINTTSHEHVEAITDPLGNAWYDSAGYENGDKCAWDFGAQLGGSAGAAYNQRIGNGIYELQQEYSNAASGCLLQGAPASPPAVTGFSPASGGRGSLVTISGSGFSGATGVSFAGVSATFTVQSDSSLVATVPAAAVSGTISVTTPGGTATSAASFSVTGTTAPINTATPAVVGTPVVGRTLTATSGTWSGAAPISYAFSWQRCRSGACTAISGAASSSYVAAASDVGSTLRVLVTASNSAGKGSVTSAQTAAVVPATPTNKSLPTISGTPQVGRTLAASPGTWSGGGTMTYEYSWARCTSYCAVIPGATASKYVVAAADRGAKLRVVVWATNAAGRAAAVSAPTATVS